MRNAIIVVGAVFRELVGILVGVIAVFAEIALVGVLVVVHIVLVVATIAARRTLGRFVIRETETGLQVLEHAAPFSGESEF